MPHTLANLKFFIQTFGCQMNESDSERIAGILERAGAKKVDKQEEGDLIIVNSCAVREKSEEKLYSYIGRLSQLRQKKAVQVGVVGCVAQLRGLELLGRRFDVDFVLGPDNYHELPQFLEKTQTEKAAATDWSKEWKETPPELVHHESRVSAYVTVMEGCNNYCTYCIVPFTRGHEKYRPLRSIHEEVVRLAAKGFKEIQLLGQNVNGYRDHESGKGFSALLREVSRIPGIEWIRFLTSHPKYFTREMAETMRANRKICRQLHLPLQSGSTSVLKRMQRGYTKEEYIEKVEDLRKLMSEVSLSTDIIVGFPGETEKDFEETCEVLQKVRFTSIFSFRFSPRPLTKASELKDDVPFEDKRRRLEVLQELQKQIQLQSHSQQVGKVMNVLCLGRNKRTTDCYSGRNEGHQVVNFRSGEDCLGRFVQVRITGYGPYSLHGERIIP